MSRVEQEHNVSQAFSRQSTHFDEEERGNPIIRHMRGEIHAHLLSLLKPSDRVLELNAGTGIDAVFLAQKGFDVLATDNAPGMLEQLERKVQAAGLGSKISVQRCSFNDLSSLHGMTFDHIFSNFGGLNCAENIEAVVAQFDALLRPGGVATLVMMPRVCPWELLLALKGNFSIAFRRLSSKGVRSHLEGGHFDTYYYSAARVAKAFDKTVYEKIALKGLGALSPPPYLYQFALKHPELYNRLCRLEKKIVTAWPFNSWADHYILSMRKK